eukprot:2747077-Ditylum_brightwellii.AAC.1
MGFILEKNGENDVLCPVMVYVDTIDEEVWVLCCKKPESLDYLSAKAERNSNESESIDDLSTKAER